MSMFFHMLMGLSRVRNPRVYQRIEKITFILSGPTALLLFIDSKVASVQGILSIHTLSHLVQEIDLDEIWKTQSGHILKMPFHDNRILLKGVFREALGTQA